MGETLAWYDDQGNPLPEEADDVTGLIDEPLDDGPVRLAVRALRDETRAIPVPVLIGSDRSALQRPGLYAWWVDATGARDLTVGLGHSVAPGLVYAGQAGATSGVKSVPSGNTLWSRLVRNHARGNARGSTFRRTLAAALTEPLGLTDPDDDRLTAWVDDHLRVVIWPVADRDALAALEEAVLRELDPPLNLQGRPTTPVRTRLSELRRAHPRSDYDPGP